MVFTSAGPAEIVRLAQKDEYFLTKLRSEVTELIQKIKGIRWWMKWHAEFDILTDVAYFTVTTLLGNQTLGEEYVNVIQVDDSLRKVPSFERRAAMVFFHLCGPYLADLWAQRTLAQLNRDSGFLHQFPNVRHHLQVILPRMSILIAILHRCHLMIFYFKVKYYHIAKRLTGIRYVLIRPWLEDGPSRWAYSFLGLLSLIQLAFSSAMYIHSYWCSRKFLNTLPTAAMNSNESFAKTKTVIHREASKACPLCLEILNFPTASPCGHVFCWNCIIQSLEIKQQCPLCSDKFGPSRLICLQNYN